MHDLRLSYLGLNIEVSSDEASDIAWLREFFEGSFEFTHDDRSKQDFVTVSLQSDASELESVRQHSAASCETISAFVLDSEVQSLPCYRSGDNLVRAYSELHDVAYIRGIETRVVGQPGCDGGGRRARGGLMRAIREHAMDHIWRCGYGILHGSAFVKNGQATVFAGEKFSGKTSALCAVLSLLPSSEFLANDRIVLQSTHDGTIAYGLPTIISIRRGSLEVTPGLADKISDIKSQYNGLPLPPSDVRDKQMLTTRQFASMLGCPVHKCAKLARVIFPTVDLQQENFFLRKLSVVESQERIRDAAFGRSHLDAHSELFAVSNSGRFPGANEKLDRLSSMTIGVPCFELRMGPRFYTREAIDRFMDVLSR